MNQAQTPYTPASPPPARRETPAAAVIAVAVGGLFLFSSLCGLLAFAVLPLQGGSDVLTTNILVASITAILLVYGGLLLFSALPMLWGRRYHAWSLPPVWVWVVVFGLVLLLGQLVLSRGLAAPYLFPPWHVLAAGIIPLAVLSYAGRRLPGPSLPSIVAEVAWGGIATIFLALISELLVGLFFVVAGVLAAMVVVGPDRMQLLVQRLTPLVRSTTVDPTALLEVLTGEPGLVLIAVIIGVLFLSGAVPFIEELLKGFGPAVAIGRARAGAGRALLWGLAAGAGYAFSENLLNGAQAAVGSGPGVLWAPLMALRAGTSLVHMAATATVSLAWWSGLVERRWARFSFMLLAAMLAHGFWNLIALIMGSALGGQQTALGQGGGPGTLILVLTLAILVLLLLAAAAWIAWLVRWAGREPNQINAQVVEEHS